MSSSFSLSEPCRLPGLVWWGVGEYDWSRILVVCVACAWDIYYALRVLRLCLVGCLSPGARCPFMGVQCELPLIRRATPGLIFLAVSALGLPLTRRAYSAVYLTLGARSRVRILSFVTRTDWGLTSSHWTLHLYLLHVMTSKRGGASVLLSHPLSHCSAGAALEWSQATIQSSIMYYLTFPNSNCQSFLFYFLSITLTFFKNHICISCSYYNYAFVQPCTIKNPYQSVIQSISLVVFYGLSHSCILLRLLYISIYILNWCMCDLFRWQYEHPLHFTAGSDVHIFCGSIAN